MGFLIQNAAAALVGLGAGVLSYQLTDAPPVMVATITACGFIGAHLPHIQQPSQPSYRVVRAASWLATLLVPLAIFLYRPTDLLPAWLIAFLFTSGLWMIIDRVSLRRDYTRTVPGIIALPLVTAGCAYLALGAAVFIPAFLASSTSYITYLLIDQQHQRNWLQTLKKPAGKIEN